VFYMRKSSKWWLWGSIGIVLLNLLCLAFRKYIDPIVFLWVVILTPVACLVLYFLTSFIEDDEIPRRNNRT